MCRRLVVPCVCVCVGGGGLMREVAIHYAKVARARKPLQHAPAYVWSGRQASRDGWLEAHGGLTRWGT
jgi:hypothetical protein